jgi:uncharacterized membrane protein YdjX (TVP38/TMEM64 family)
MGLVRPRRGHAKRPPMIRIPFWLRVTLGVAAVGALALFFGRGHFTADGFREKVDEMSAFLAAYGAWMPLVYVALHVALSTVAPRLIMGTIAGVAFGLWSGLLWSMVGAMAGSLVGFWIARFIRGDTVVIEEITYLGIGPMLERAEAGGWRAIMFARLIPYIPNPVLNYALGATRVSLADYVLGSLLGMLPSGFVYANFGASGRYALGGGPGWVEPLAWGAALLLLALLLPKLMQRWIKP